MSTEKHGDVVEPCSYCDKTFSRSLGRICHMRSCHPEQFVFSCLTCDFKYEREEDLIKHKEKYRGRCNRAKQKQNTSADANETADMNTNNAANPVDIIEATENANSCDNVDTNDRDINENMSTIDNMDANENMDSCDNMAMDAGDTMDTSANMDARHNMNTSANMDVKVSVKINVDENICAGVESIADSNTMAESLLQDVDNTVPLECAEYAVLHGKHAAQLEYLQLYPNMKISWERITSWITNNGLTKKYNENNSRFSKGQRPEIPSEIKKDCTEAALNNGVESTQIKFTMKYKEYIFAPYLIRKWVYDAKNPKLIKDATDIPMDADCDIKVEKLDPIFPETFVELVKHKIGDMLEVSDEEFLKLIESLINEHNSKSEEKVHIEETSPELLLSLKDFKTKGSFSCKGCKSMYKSEEELTKHKLKCWVPDFEESGLTRSQRACRTKPIKDESEEINEGESETEENMMETAQNLSAEVSNIFTCGECKIEFGTKRRLGDHRRALHKDSTRSYRRRSNITENHDFKRNKKTEEVGLFTCSKCSRAHISKSGLCAHMRVTHDIWVTDKMEEISLRCEQCEKLCFNYGALEKHGKDCTNEPVTIEYGSDKVPEDFLNFNDVALLKPIIFICPRCYVRYPSLEVLGNHYIAKSCTRVPRPTDPECVKA